MQTVKPITVDTEYRLESEITYLNDLIAAVPDIVADGA